MYPKSVLNQGVLRNTVFYRHAACLCFSRGWGPRPALSPPASHNAGVSAPPNVWDVQPGGQFLALMGAPVPRTSQSGMPVGVHVAQAPRPPQHGCARSSEEENVIHTPTPGGLLPPSRMCGETRGPAPRGGGGALGSGVGVVFRDLWACDLV